jgi:uncharacterized protein YdhG (YjbR/CyaY superfamily)
MPERIKFTSHKQYIASAPAAVQPILLKVQALVEAALPGAERCISYNMPAFRMGKVFFYFAAFRNHLGIYPPLTDDAALVGALSRYRNEKGNLRFPYKEPIPYEVIRDVVLALARQYARK